MVQAIFTYLIFAVFLGVLIAGLLWKGAPLRGMALDRIEQAAKSFKGVVDPGTYFRMPRIRFEVHGYPAELKWGRVRRAEDGSDLLLFTAVRLGVAVPGSIKIWDKRVPWISRVDFPWGLPLIPSGDPALDSEFVVKARPVSLGENLFAGERRGRMAPLARELAGSFPMSLSCGVLRSKHHAGSIVASGLSSYAARLREFTGLLLEVAGRAPIP